MNVESWIYFGFGILNRSSRMEIPAKEDFDVVWMEDPLIQSECSDLMMEHVVDSPFFVDSNSQILAEDEIRCRSEIVGLDGFMMLEDLDESSRWYVNEIPKETLLENDSLNSSRDDTSLQTGIQNISSGYRKIKPVKHPGLKLQTPIAYQRDTDLNVIPIQADGRAVCLKCGAIGVKHAFYTRERRYCSLACARGSDESNSKNQEMVQSPSSTQWTEETLIESEKLVDDNPSNINCKQNQFELLQQSVTGAQLPVFVLPPEDPPFPPICRRSSTSSSYDWIPELSDPLFVAAPTYCFSHVPMAELWHNIVVGLKVEVENTDCYDFIEEFPKAFWIASVLRVEGYKALLRYEGFVEDNSKDFWVNLCSSLVHPVGWCAERGKPLIPPKSIKNKYLNWKEFLKRRLTGARTLPSNFYSKILDSLKSRFRCDLTVEVVDKTKISQVKVATIEKIVGKRLQLRYYDSKCNSRELFWCHEDSFIIHPVGWAQRIGQKLDAPVQYKDRVMKGLREKYDATTELFATPERIRLPQTCFFQESMKLEAIDPLNLGEICVATVMQILNDGYLMIRVDFWNDQNPTENDWFCYHMTSPCIFPAGFCAANEISLTPPKDYNKSTFDWNRYLLETGCVSAPPELFKREIPDHGFKVGMKLESADLMNPKLICVATIKRVVGRLLRIHFDGWEDSFDQWIDCSSCDIYPVGWCELVSHHLESPLSESSPVSAESKSKGEVEKKLRNQCNEKENSSLNSFSNKNMHLGDKSKMIPRLSDCRSRIATSAIIPLAWDVNDVSEFLKINNCSTYCDAFIKEGIDGRKLMELTKDEVLALVGMKVGPSLKVQNLIKQLLSNVPSGQFRYKKLWKK